MEDSLSRTPMNRRVKFDAASFILDREIRNRTNKQTHKHTKKQTVTDISTPCLSASVDKNLTAAQITESLYFKTPLPHNKNCIIQNFMYWLNTNNQQTHYGLNSNRQCVSEISFKTSVQHSTAVVANDWTFTADYITDKLSKHTEENAR